MTELLYVLHFVSGLDLPAIQATAWEWAMIEWVPDDPESTHRGSHVTG